MRLASSSSSAKNSSRSRKLPGSMSDFPEGQNFQKRENLLLVHIGLRAQLASPLIL